MKWCLGIRHTVVWFLSSANWFILAWQDECQAKGNNRHQSHNRKGRIQNSMLHLRFVFQTISTIQLSSQDFYLIRQQSFIHINLDINEEWIYLIGYCL